jgi:hypothetical protein
MKKILGPIAGIVGMILIALSVFWILGYPIRGASRASTSKAPLAVPAGDLAPSDAWLTDFDEYIRLSTETVQKQKDLQAEKEVRALQDEIDRATGMQQRLNQSVPQGYTFDAKMRVFVPVPKPTGEIVDGKVHPTPMPAAPAPPAKK